MAEFLQTLNAILWKSCWPPVPLQTLGGIKALLNEHAVKGAPTAPAAPQAYAHPHGNKAWQGLSQAAAAGAPGGSTGTRREGPLWGHSSFTEMENTGFKAQIEKWRQKKKHKHTHFSWSLKATLECSTVVGTGVAEWSLPLKLLSVVPS